MLASEQPALVQPCFRSSGPNDAALAGYIRRRHSASGASGDKQKTTPAPISVKNSTFHNHAIDTKSTTATAPSL